ncbi:hypothetical protein DPMN_015795 [Dreissena polymorpha]|uniref:Uncharacterized protein n=1 Tax=Dreissena polymorpha TaxID=45954 RepID=A0A9D4S5T5_DREPO|nr:hypothetical protein DPMN_015795 [Dreissena polymorpha]
MKQEGLKVAHLRFNGTDRFCEAQDVIRTKVLTNFHEHFYNSHITKNAPPPGGHVFQATGTIFKLVQDIVWTYLLAKFHDDRTINFSEDRNINVASRVLTSRIRKNAPPPCCHATGIIFELVQDIIWMKFLTNFHEDRTINVASRVQTRENAPPLGSHIIETNLLTKFHE